VALDVRLVDDDSLRRRGTLDSMTSIDDLVEEHPSPSRKITPGRIALGILVAASFSVWVYGFSGLAARTAPDTLGNESFMVLADPACESANDAVALLPNALDAENHVERAQQVRTNTALYADLVDDLEQILDDPAVTLNERDRGITLEWLADWRQFLADRIDFADRLEDDPQAVFYVAASSGGERLERRITRFANTNDLVNCITPSDVG
jgi:hypothetical protein